MADVRFFLDENVQIVIAEQLRRRSIDALSVHHAGLQGTKDAELLRYATALGRVFCTHDTDFAEIAALGVEHAGIVNGYGEFHTIGDWVRGLTLYQAIDSAEEFVNRLEWL